MSHGPMTVEQARQYSRMVRDEDADRVEKTRRKRYESNLREEYRHLKDFKVVLKDPDGSDYNTSYRLEELFDMFTLTKNWREYVSSEFQ